MADISQPDRLCDLVMKGGVTSGILYPPAIHEIAKKFYFVGISGTSAGAIAACAAAAAEYRRRTTGSNRGFELLEQLPYELAKDGNLAQLFRPDASTKKLAAFLLERFGANRQGWLKRCWWKSRLLWRLLRRNRILKPVVENNYGLCTGMANGNRPLPGKIPPLTEWLTHQIDTIAGIEGDRPLTFGDLWNAPIPQHLRSAMTGLDDRSIDLRAVTTCVSFGRPFELPFNTRIFAFDPQEWSLLFPKKVLDHLIREGEKIDAPKIRRDGKLPLPSGDQLPIVVAARMSLSYPGLFSMVPLWAVDYEQEEPPLARVWFSDGGITSNFPIHRFDAIFPRWPTLGINLQYTDKEGVAARRLANPDLLYLPESRRQGVNDLWVPFGDESATSDVMGFVKAILWSSRVWHDNSFLKLPGYRDRVIEIWLRPEEGGLNLSMPEDVIRRLIDRGREGAIQICDRFTDVDDQDPMSWTGHRWTRYRSAMAGLTAVMQGFRLSVVNGMPCDAPLSELLSDVNRPPCYKFRSEAQRRASEEATSELLRYLEGLEKTLEDPPETFESLQRPFHHPPNPPIEFGSRAPV